MKICFIGSEISNVFEGEILGGAQKQLALIIEGIKSKGFEVMVLEYHLKEPKIVNDISFYPAWHKDRVFFLSKLKDIILQINEKSVDAIYVRGTQLYVAFLYLILKIKRPKIKLLWGIAGDHDLSSKYNYLRVNQTSSWYGKINSGFLFNLSSILIFYFSDTIICQTEEQVIKCRSKSKDRPIVQISNIYISNNHKEIKNSSQTIADAIWIGKFSGNKGEEILLKMANDIPEMKVICLGHVTKNFKKTEIFQLIKKQKNLILVGRVSEIEVDEYISKIDFILNTSPSEGLSNVFLEGWNQEKPVISFTVNPNQYLSLGKAGYCAENSYSSLIIKLHSILKNKEFMNYHGKKGKEILLTSHNSEMILTQYKNLFLNF